MIKHNILRYIFFFLCNVSFLSAMNSASMHCEHTVLREIIFKGDIELLEHVLRLYTLDEINACNEHGQTLLDYAFILGYHQAVALLLQYGARGDEDIFNKDKMIQELMSLKNNDTITCETIQYVTHCVKLNEFEYPALYRFLNSQKSAMFHHCVRYDREMYLTDLCSVDFYICCQPYCLSDRSPENGCIDYTNSACSAWVMAHIDCSSVIILGIDFMLFFLKSIYTPFCYFPMLAHEYGLYLDALRVKDSQNRIDLASDSLLAQRMDEGYECRADLFSNTFVDDFYTSSISLLGLLIFDVFLDFFYETYPQNLNVLAVSPDVMLTDKLGPVIYALWELIFSNGDNGTQFFKKCAHCQCLKSLCYTCFRQSFRFNQASDHGYVFKSDLFMNVFKQEYASCSCEVNKDEDFFYTHPSLRKRFQNITIDLIFGAVINWFNTFKRKYEHEHFLKLFLTPSYQSVGIAIVPFWQDGEISSISICIGTESILQCYALHLFSCTEDIVQEICLNIHYVLDRYCERVFQVRGSSREHIVKDSIDEYSFEESSHSCWCC
ncbi:MAG: hypothetical protein US69_C0001G0043 [candidate division TM6 bacterium GW2011_GWF2_38_10]|nr:MAG: hypothetical protein US69_C0001G0043 [candidate division TM6 bacterium GW2011_GWF2_38_10]